MPSPESTPEQESLFDVSEYVDKLYENSDKAAHLIMGKMVDLVHERYGPLGDERSIVHGDDW